MGPRKDEQGREDNYCADSNLSRLRARDTFYDTRDVCPPHSLSPRLASLVLAARI